MFFSLKNKIENKKGFTLIEVMVSSSILALLAAIIFANINQGRVKAAEVKNIQEAKSLNTAMNLYQFDQGKLPATTASAADAGDPDNPNYPNQIIREYESDVENKLVPEYIPKLPGDFIVDDWGVCKTFPAIGRSCIKLAYNGYLAKDSNMRYRCGPGSKADKAVIVILNENTQQVPDELSLYAESAYFSNGYGKIYALETTIINNDSNIQRVGERYISHMIAPAGYQMFNPDGSCKSSAGYSNKCYAYRCIPF